SSLITLLTKGINLTHFLFTQLYGLDRKKAGLSPKMGQVQTEKEEKGGAESEPRHSWFLIEKKFKKRNEQR
ncbi:hypothetical protein, partial [Cytobacillus firmus]|uniref:hypothetical protein n=1 Tax=Cytobacillus firmus TaxID=1399 RepID=UPI001C2EFE87